MTTFGLALGGGGVKGLAHIALLKKLDDMDCKPARIAGTSIGAILGALYAAGLSGRDIEARVRDHIFSRGAGLKHAYKKRRHLVKWVKVFAFERERGGIITADGLFEHLFTEIANLSFEELDIPFTAIAADFHNGQEVALNSGSLLDAVRASMAVPGVFAPVAIGDRLLVDGGVVNNVPCEHAAVGIKGPLIASDVISLSKTSNPKTTQVLSGALSIMLRQATELNYKRHPPDFIFRPDTRNIDAFDFHKIAKTLERGEESVTKNASELEALLKQG